MMGLSLGAAGACLQGMHLSEDLRKKMAIVAVEETKKASDKHICILDLG